MDFLTRGALDTQQLLLECMGVGMSNVKAHRMKKSLFLIGPSNTGKSQLKRLLERLIGAENYASIDLDELEARFGTSTLFNKRLAGSSDMSFITVKELKSFKKATGGDALFAEFKGENAFSFVFNGFLWFCANRMPMFGGDKSDAVFNRIMVVKCDHVPEVLDRQLQDKMFAERDYIVSKCMRALKTVIDNDYNFSIPDGTLALVDEYKTNVNSFLRFMDDCTEERPGEAVRDGCTCKRFYDVYVAWCRDHNQGYSESRRDITPLLIEREQDKIKTIKGKTYYSAFTLTDETKLAYYNAYDHFEDWMKDAQGDPCEPILQPPTPPQPLHPFHPNGREVPIYKGYQRFCYSIPTPPKAHPSPPYRYGATENIEMKRR